MRQPRRMLSRMALAAGVYAACGLASSSSSSAATFGFGALASPAAAGEVHTSARSLDMLAMEMVDGSVGEVDAADDGADDDAATPSPVVLTDSDGSGEEESASTSASADASDKRAIPDNGYLKDIVSKEDFATWWAPNAVYSYEALAKAAKEFFDGGFLPKDEPVLRKREFAAFIAHALAETNLKTVEAGSPVFTSDGKENKYCDRTYVSCANGESYHGRGPMLMQGNTNYARCSKALGLNNLLLTDPDRVATDATIAWGSAIWMWMKDEGLGSAQANAMSSAEDAGFAASTAALKGSIECGKAPLKANGDSSRAQIYNATCGLLEIEPDANMFCSPQKQADSASADPATVASSIAIKKYLPKKAFKKLFPTATDLYSYEALIKAAANYPEFAASSDNDEDNALELAAFLAEAAAATNKLVYRVKPKADSYSDDVFCESGAGMCLDGRSYYGRGPFMTEWNTMYSRLSDDLGLELLRNPDLLSKDSDVAWLVAMHIWMVDLGNGRPHDYVSKPEILARASEILFGSGVCGTLARDSAADGLRVDLFMEIATAMGMEGKVNKRKLSCATSDFDAVEQATPFSKLFSDDDFAKFFPDATTHYSYHTLVEATKMFPTFAGEDDQVSNKREIAAFLAHAAVGSHDFTRAEVDNGALYLPESFCDSAVTDCIPEKRYHGRGPFAVAWNYNYMKCGSYIDVDLLRHPEYVYIDSVISWKSALWYWMQHRPLTSYGTLHAVMHRHLDSDEENFRLSTIMVAGQTECGSENELHRVDNYNAISEHLGIQKGDETALKCEKVSSDKSSDSALNSQVARILSEVTFSEITASGGHPSALYDRTALLYAANVFPAFAGSAEETTNRREIAAFLAQVASVTGEFEEVEDKTAADECTAPPCYYKRGPLMIDGVDTYAMIRRSIDKNIIQQPEILTTDADAAWQSALFIWMADNGNGSIHEYIRISDFGFASTLNILSPELCGESAQDDANAQKEIERRVELYKRYCAFLDIEPEEILTCQDSTFQAYDPTSVETAAGTGGFANIMSKDLFVEFFPDADPLYTYNAIMDAASKFPKFVNDGPDRQNRQEAAAFIAQMAHASGNFTFTQQSGWSLFPPSEYCDKTSSYECDPEERYHGRGPIQMTWNYNYGSYGDEIKVDLLGNPDWVATDSKIAWGSAIWYWMLDQGNGRGSIHDVFTRGTANNFDYDYAMTTWLLNGGLECGSAPVAPEPEAQRIRLYQRYAARFHVEPGKKKSCHTSDYEPQTR